MKRALFYSNLSKSFFALVSFLFLFTPLWGQDEEAGQTPFFREDQWYLGASFMILQTKETAFKPQGLSRHFQWGFIRDIPLTSNGKLATGIGLGMSFERYTTNFSRVAEGVGKFHYTIADQPAAPLFFSTHALELPLSFRWRNATPDDFAFWRVYGGVSLRWNYTTKIRQDALEIKNSSDIQNLGAVANLSFGYNTWNFYIAYPLTPFFNESFRNANQQPLDLNPIKIGLIFYIL